MGEILPLFNEATNTQYAEARCSECGNIFIPKNITAKTCSIECRFERKNRLDREKRRVESEARRRISLSKKDKTESQHWDIIVFYLNGNSLQKTETEFNISGPLLKKILKNHDIEIRDSSYYWREKDKSTEELKKLALQEYVANNITKDGLSKKYGISKKKIGQLTLGVKKMVGVSSKYKTIKKPNHPRADKQGMVLEHLLTAEIKLGRVVSKNEQVHHIDFNKQNNSPSNLAVGEPKSHGFWHRTHSEVMSILMPIMLEFGVISFDEVGGYDLDAQKIKKLGKFLRNKNEAKK